MITVRHFQASDEEAANAIMTSATGELRTTYKPKPIANALNSDRPPSIAKVVALIDECTIAGVAEFLAHESFLYVQGIAVAPANRRLGIARALLEHIEGIAAGMQLSVLRLKTIKEAGNAETFRRLGFHMIEERISERFIGLQGKAVTEMTLSRSVAKL